MQQIEVEVQTKSVFARLEFTRFLLIASIGLGLMLGVFGTFRIFSSYKKARLSNADLVVANRAMAIANDAMTRAQASLATRTEQLVEAQSLGRLGEWSFRLGEPDFYWATETYALLGYDPEKFHPSRDAVMSALVGDGARLIMDSQAAVMRSGEVTSVDVRIRRGDGSIGDFMVTIKGLHGADGRIIGFLGTYQDISERKFAEAQLEKLAYYDSLTGLPNRALFQRELNDTLTNCKRTGTEGALLLLDLDRFKEVNDTLGHAAGDELLGKVSHLITRVLGPDRFIARLGGDEFAVILTRADDAVAEETASAIISAVCSSISLSRGEVIIGTSIGIARIPHDGATTVEALRNADLALYRAKEDGRGRFALFHRDLNEVVQQKTALARDLRRAVQEGGELSVHYQPQIELSTGRVIGLETLMRWTHPTRGNVPPSEFIPIAESSSLICELGSWILREAALQGRAWLDAGEPPREIAVNVSAAQIWHSNLVEDVKRVLEETGLPPHLLCLELTESVLANQLDGRVGIVLNTLKSLGVTLALDDFGTNYSSLGYLIGLPFDKLKIDRIFIDGVANSTRAQKLLEGIIALGRGLGMKTIAEGAEIPREVEILRSFGCDMVQGFIFARPAPAIEALANVHALELNGPGKPGASLHATDAAATRAPVRPSTSEAARSHRQSA